MAYELFDKEEMELQISEVMALINDLRPAPEARLISRVKLRMMAALAGDERLVELAHRASDTTLFWQLPDETIEQQVMLVERPID